MFAINIVFPPWNFEKLDVNTLLFTNTQAGVRTEHHIPYLLGFDKSTFLMWDQKIPSTILL
jgi:hypothetical protein